MNIPVEARVDAKELAEILTYLDDKGVVVETKSHLLRLCVSMLHTVLNNRGTLEYIEATDAIRILRDRFHLSDRGTRSVNRALQSIHLEEDELQDIGLPIQPKTKRMMNEAMEALRRMEKEG